ncbi:MAG: pyrroline-5-carboxylate reductase [Dehalococcoidia bacterium]|nr:pyrroline-5-carboxylate reductase [Dehalococcoidia bacterium]
MVGKLALIGGGFMGEAILSRIIAAGVVAPSDVFVGEPVAERRDALTTQYQVHAVADNLEAVADAAVVLLAIKPQQTEPVFASLRDALAPATLVVSIVAGMSLSALTEGLDHQPVARAMPNTPAAVGEGMTVWTATPAVSEEQLTSVQAIFGAIGREVQVDGNHYVDMATAVSGSGPGYVFLVIEALIDAAVQLGLARPAAHELVVQTVLGSAALARETGEHPAELRNRVTTPGGTTAAGLHAMEEGGLRAALARGVIAAYERSMALGAGGRAGSP